MTVPPNPIPPPSPARLASSPSPGTEPSATRLAGVEDEAPPEVLAARALEPLEGLGERDVVEHSAAYDAVHRALSALLPGDAGRR